MNGRSVLATAAIALSVLMLCLASPAKAALSYDDAYFDEDAGPQTTIADPLEGMNRTFYGFNDFLYRNLLRPMAVGYGAVMPAPFRRGFGNAYQNVLYPVRLVNSLLQGNIGKAGRETWRFLVNTIFGFGGLFDLARDGLNIKQSTADFGQTLGVWGVGHGFYIVVPFIGPCSLRDGTGRIVDLAFSPVSYATQPVLPPPWYWSWVARIADAVNDFSMTYEQYDAFLKAAVEPYAAQRDAYVQYRAKVIGEK